MDTQSLDIFLFFFTTIGWLVAYIEAIRIGFKQKTYCIPFVALALNFTWEIAASKYYPVFNFYSLTYFLWAMFDVLIVVTYLLYGYRDFKEHTGGGKIAFYVWSISVFVIAAAWQTICRLTLRDWLIVTAFNMNILMSILFIYMLWNRKSSRGQSLVLAVAKSFGTLGPMLQGMFTMDNLQMWGWGLIGYCFDVTYTILLYRTIRAEKAMVKSPKGKKKQNT